MHAYTSYICAMANLYFSTLVRQLTGSFCLMLMVSGLVSTHMVKAEDEYEGLFLYTKTNLEDTGGCVIPLTEESMIPNQAILVGHRSRKPYEGYIDRERRRISFQHLPVDKYDLVLVTDEAFYENVQLVPFADASTDNRDEDRQLIQDEIMKIEGFFDHKKVHIIQFRDTSSGTLVQQWREKVALKQSGARVPGSIHSLDLIWFERPLKGWQLTRRRQIWRQELPKAEPMRHIHLETLQTIRITTTIKTLPVLAIPEPGKPMPTAP